MTGVSDTIPVKCAHCGRAMKVPAGKRGYLVRHNKPTIDFCSRACNVTYIAQRGNAAQEAQWTIANNTSRPSR